MTELGKRPALRAGPVWRALRWSLALVVLAMLIFVARYYEADPGADAPRVLVSVDRTLWNRVGLNRMTYLRALRRAGLRPVLMDYSTVELGLDAGSLLDNIDGLLISGGGDVAAVHYGGDESITRDVNPARDEFELQLLAAAEQRGMPMLGLCRGAQLLNVHRGGTLGDFRDDSARYQRHKRLWGGHPVEIETGTRLARIYADTHLPSVVTWHGQYVKRLGEDVVITAYAPDGTPEAIELTTEEPFGMIGVQWHAEVLPWDKRQEKLFAAFQAAAERYRAGRSRQ